MCAPDIKAGPQVPNAEPAEACSRHVVVIFPAICPQFLEKLASDLAFDPNVVINCIVDQEEKGSPYPRKPPPSALKRKRSTLDDEAEETARARRIYDAPNCRQRVLTAKHHHQIRELIFKDFPQIPPLDIQSALSKARKFLFPVYLALYESVFEREEYGKFGPWSKVAAALPSQGRYSPRNLDKTIEKCLDPVERDTLLELQAARRTAASHDRQLRAELERDAAEKAKFENAYADGHTRECKCCFDEFALNRMAQCNGEPAHLFCFACCRRQAESLVGLNKYELACMSMNDCKASFSHAQRQLFLDEKLATALERAEQHSMLRLANLENLVYCPFCPFGAECSSIEEDREFRCQNPDCQIVSCRLCQKETHVPKTCQEAAREHGVSARRTIEEAMSAALIRRCNKCDAPFIKEDGCNKMTCTRPGCRHVQCYICSMSCDYSHFNDPDRGKEGNCPLFDSVETRHAEIKQAEDKTRKEMLGANPDMDPEHLKFHLSDRVSQDDKRREQFPGHPPEDAPLFQRLRVPRFEYGAVDAPAEARMPHAPPMANEARLNAGRGHLQAVRLPPNMGAQEAQPRQRHVPPDGPRQSAAIQAHRGALASGEIREDIRKSRAHRVHPWVGGNGTVDQDSAANRPAHGVYPRLRERPAVAGQPGSTLDRAWAQADKRPGSDASVRARANPAAPPLRGHMALAGDAPRALAVQARAFPNHNQLFPNGYVLSGHTAMPGKAIPPTPGHNEDQAGFQNRGLPQAQRMLRTGRMVHPAVSSVPRDQGLVRRNSKTAIGNTAAA